MRPWTRWWWLGSAVDKPNLSHLLETYRDAGLGGVEVTPIYGVQGQEARDIPYLSPQWVEMLAHTSTEAQRLGMGVDMATGTGWPFGGPNVSDTDAEDKLVIEKTVLPPGLPAAWRNDDALPHALVAVSAQGESVPLLDCLDTAGRLQWTPPPGAWTLYCVRQAWAGRTVKRAAPGGAGKCINPFSGPSLARYLAGFDAPLGALPPGALRCQFHDSFEYLADWAPALFAEFAARRGYDLRAHLPALAGDADPDETARVKTDWRETLADMLRENFTQAWTDWAHGRGEQSRNQAHGSPGNLLDLYGTVDIPETEIFGGLGDPRACKFASSAAHVMGRALTSSESCTWLAEHFTVSLALAKAAIDRLLAAGVNHLFYHGTAYSPADAPWPGWLFYASTTFTPSDPLWHDFPTLNTYVTRCQSLLQEGAPDNDILLFWPLHDLWQTRPEAYMLEIDGKWLTQAPIGQTAQELWDRGYAFDYISDRQLALAQVEDGGIRVPGGHYQIIVVPPCAFLPETTLATLLDLARAGATVIFEQHMPSDVPGWGDLAARRATFQALLGALHWQAEAEHGARRASVGAGEVWVGADIAALLSGLAVPRETAADRGVLTIRRRHADGFSCFLTNQGTEEIDGWVALARPFHSAALMDPMTGVIGNAQTRTHPDGSGDVFLQLPPGASIFVRTWTADTVSNPPWQYQHTAGAPWTVPGPWTVEFIEGGPDLPPAFQTQTPGSWAEQGDAASRFAGTARYSTSFDAPGARSGPWLLRLGRVCESARVRLNGEPVGTLIAPPFAVPLGALRTHGNRLEIEVTNLAANRIRDRDRRGLPWKVFHEINFVDIRYQPFDASAWPVRESGLLGPVQLVPLSNDASDTRKEL